MTLFQPDTTLKILILWAGAKRKPSALAIRDGLRSKAIAGYEFCIITEDHSDPRYGRLSEQAINAADCILMIAAEVDWQSHDSAIRERDYFNTLVRSQTKTHNQFSFVRIAKEEPPKYENAGMRTLSFSNPEALTDIEINNTLDYFIAVKEGKAPIYIELSSATLLAPGGLLTATLWLATFDDEVLHSSIGPRNKPSSRSFVEALRRLKALHSVHSGLGAMIKGPIAALQQDLPPGVCDISRLRKQIVNALDVYRSPQSSALNDALADCIYFGLLPTLRLLAQRLSAMPSHSKELLFLEAAMERLSAILDDRRELESDTARYDGPWWVEQYACCLDLVQTRFEVLASDVDISGLVHPQLTSPLAERQFCETLKIAKNLLAATVQWTFSVLVVFSFLHVHRPAKVENFVPNNVGDAVEQLISDWRHNGLTDAVVNWSNQMILRLLAVAEDDEDAIHAAT